MTVYFTASIAQNNIYGSYYKRIVDYLKEKGFKVYYEHIIEKALEDIYSATEEHNSKHYDNVQKWISEADLVVAEGSFPSTLNVGYEITYALDKGKPVICLYSKGKHSTFFRSIKSEKLIYEEYTDHSLEDVLNNSIELAQDTADIRFNFIISPSLLEYLDWIAKNKKLPRSVYLRRLIEEDMAKNKGYKV